jgi:hypothetical protein
MGEWLLAFVPEERADRSQARSASAFCIALVIRPDGPAPKGQENLAQGSPWVRRNIRFALKGLEMRTRSGSKVRSRFSPYLVTPSGLIRVGRDFPG